MNITNFIDIAAPPEKIWPFIIEPEKILNWFTLLRKFEYTGEQRSGTGTTFYYEEKSGPRLMRFNFEVTEWMEKEKIAFVSTRDGDPEIYTIDIDGRNLQQLTHNDVNDAYPGWSPDGKQIVFNSERDGIREIYIMDSDGKNQKRLTKSEKGKFFPSWSPDGKKIVFFSFETDIKKRNIYVMDADGGDIHQITNTAYVDEGPCWSPDGKYIAFQSNRTGNYQIYKMNADGSNQQNISNNKFNEYWPSWTSRSKLQNGWKIKRKLKFRSIQKQ